MTFFTLFYVFFHKPILGFFFVDSGSDSVSGFLNDGALTHEVSYLIYSLLSSFIYAGISR